MGEPEREKEPSQNPRGMPGADRKPSRPQMSATSPTLIHRMVLGGGGGPTAATTTPARGARGLPQPTPSSNSPTGTSSVLFSASLAAELAAALPLTTTLRVL